MKQVLFLVFITLLGVNSSFSTSFEFQDSAFVNYLLSNKKVNPNQDNILDSSEIFGVKKLKINDPKIISIKGIGVFQNLEKLSLKNCQLDGKLIFLLPKLNSLDVRGNSITKMFFIHQPSKIKATDSIAIETIDWDNEIIVKNDVATHFNTTGSGQVIFEGHGNQLKIKNSNVEITGSGNDVIIVKGNANSITINNKDITTYDSESIDTLIIEGDGNDYYLGNNSEEESYESDTYVEDEFYSDDEDDYDYLVDNYDNPIDYCGEFDLNRYDYAVYFDISYLQNWDEFFKLINQDSQTNSEGFQLDDIYFQMEMTSTFPDSSMMYYKDGFTLSPSRNSEMLKDIKMITETVYSAYCNEYLLNGVEKNVKPNLDLFYLARFDVSYTEFKIFLRAAIIGYLKFFTEFNKLEDELVCHLDPKVQREYYKKYPFCIKFYKQP